MKRDGPPSHPENPVPKGSATGRDNSFRPSSHSQCATPFPAGRDINYANNLGPISQCSSRPDPAAPPVPRSTVHY